LFQSFIFLNRRDQSEISQVFKVGDIFTIWLAISGIIRVKTPIVST
jgi:hypothetical protein